MMAFLSEYFLLHGIRLFAPVPLSSCTVRKPYLLEREGLDTDAGTVIMLAIPYLSRQAETEDRNLSAYAVPRDYHLFWMDLFGDLLPRLRTTFPTDRFAAFADHSPIDEREAAAKAGLGIIGKNGLLITEPYSSYVFLGELVTSRVLPCEAKPVVFCEDCGRCRAACPMPQIGSCLSALTQKKGTLTDGEIAALRKYGSVWGCDICQEVCPHTARARRSGTVFSGIPFFEEQTLPHLTRAILDGMTDETFRSRAYAWRGRETIRRNLMLTEQPEAPEKGKEDSSEC